jgi:hypothetical protein
MARDSFITSAYKRDIRRIVPHTPTFFRTFSLSGINAEAGCSKLATLGATPPGPSQPNPQQLQK